MKLTVMADSMADSTEEAADEIEGAASSLTASCAIAEPAKTRAVAEIR